MAPSFSRRCCCCFVALQQGVQVAGPRVCAAALFLVLYVLLDILCVVWCFTAADSSAMRAGCNAVAAWLMGIDVNVVQHLCTSAAVWQRLCS